MSDFDRYEVIVETRVGLHVTIAHVLTQEHGALVGRAVSTMQPNYLDIHYAWVRDISDPRAPLLVSAWPSRTADERAASKRAYYAFEHMMKVQQDVDISKKELDA